MTVNIIRLYAASVEWRLLYKRKAVSARTRNLNAGEAVEALHNLVGDTRDALETV